MTVSHFKKDGVRLTGWALLGLALLWLSVGIGRAQEEASPGKLPSDRIKVSADRLVADQGAQFAEFSGNVRASQGDTVITCNQLRIHYATGDDQPAGGGEPIEKIVAEGSVTIRFDDKVAQTDQATYTTRDQVLVLSGEDSTVTSGKDAISGSKIIVDRISETIRVESGQKPVEAVFYPAGKGID